MIQIGFIFFLFLCGYVCPLPTERPTGKKISSVVNKSSSKRSLDFDTSYSPWVNLDWHSSPNVHFPSQFQNSLDYLGSAWQNKINLDNQLELHSFDLHSNQNIHNLANLYQEDFTLLGAHNTLPVEIHKNGHFTPDYSDGLAYPDPYLLLGSRAKQVANYLYSKELFFNDIPHLRALKHNQEERIKNGLEPKKLGSLRGGLPYSREFFYK